MLFLDLCKKSILSKFPKQWMQKSQIIDWIHLIISGSEVQSDRFPRRFEWISPPKNVTGMPVTEAHS